MEHKEITVHTDEVLSVTYNPAVHEVTTTELPDGRVMLIIQPKATVTGAV